MRKIISFACLFFLMSAASHLHAQSINNRNWRTFIGDPINDTLTFHIRSDSSFVTNSSGATILNTNCMISGDTLTLSDYGTGDYACPDMKGAYKINLNGKILTLKLINDACEGRTHALDGIKWTESLQ
jgi:hypothetical protein